MWNFTFNFRTFSILTSSSVAPLCVSCASWRSQSCSNPSCQQSEPVWSIDTVTCAAMLSWQFTPSTGKNFWYFLFCHLSKYTNGILCSSQNNPDLTIVFLFRNFEHLIPDAPELIHDFLVNEKDASCKRNAFMMLIHADQVCAMLSLLQWLLLVPLDPQFQSLT